MSANNDDGIDAPAFPRNYLAGGHNGMTLRDYFAAKAMQAMITKTGGTAGAPLMAQYAYEFADAMLKARTKTGGPA